MCKLTDAQKITALSGRLFGIVCAIMALCGVLICSRSSDVLGDACGALWRVLRLPDGMKKGPVACSPVPVLSALRISLCS